MLRNVDGPAGTPGARHVFDQLDESLGVAIAAVEIDRDLGWRRRPRLIEADDRAADRMAVAKQPQLQLWTGLGGQHALITAEPFEVMQDTVVVLLQQHFERRVLAVVADRRLTRAVRGGERRGQREQLAPRRQEDPSALRSESSRRQARVGVGSDGP